LQANGATKDSDAGFRERGNAQREADKGDQRGDEPERAKRVEDAARNERVKAAQRSQTARIATVVQSMNTENGERRAIRR
jgi:hypothetical protein